MNDRWLRKRGLVAMVGLVISTAACSAAGRTGGASVRPADDAVQGIRAGAPTEDAAAHPPAYEYHADHDPNGIGKFYMGREIAQVMGHEAADWLDRPEREKEEAPERMLDALKIKPGSSVADIGAGSGYLTFRLVRRVGPHGLVYANDIQPEMLDIIQKRMKTNGVTNVKTILGSITDPRLPANSVDLIIMVDVYHEFDHPWEMTRGMVRALKAGGRLVFIEYRLEDPRVPIKTVHKMSEQQVRKEMSIFPLKWLLTDERLPIQHIIEFRKVG